MPVDRQAPPPRDRADADGIRVTDVPVRPGRRRTRSALVWGIGLAVAVLAGFVLWPRNAPAPAPQSSATPIRDARLPASPPLSARPAPSAAMRDARDTGDTTDPDNLANHFGPGDAEPTGAELIGALHDAGVRTGIGAFNPPGTSPPLEGLEVPEGFTLPPGYVRHHQVTDSGDPLPPILMFSPDFVLRDAQGRALPMPENRVVPPELAPPGLPLRRVRVPPTP